MYSVELFNYRVLRQIVLLTLRIQNIRLTDKCLKPILYTLLFKIIMQ